MNHQLGEHYHASHDSIAKNTRRKRKEVDDATPPPMNQASTSCPTPHILVTSAQPNVASQQR